MKRALSVLLLAIGAAPGCSIERLRPADSATADAATVAAADSGPLAATATDGATNGTTTGATNGATDGAADTVPPPPEVPSPPPAALPGDTLPLVATPAELRELAAQLIIPVQGVAADALRDTYTESRGTRLHEAIDILAPRNTPVLAATDGRVLKLHESVAGGLMVYAADASDRFVMMYGHLERYADGLAEGATLRRGQVIGYVGTSGNAPPGTPHLHFVIGRGRPSVSWWRATAVNPYPLLTGRSAAP
jgi:murein DD-endopeptidase MepM/ murein hydrolase activator NlpD